MPTIVLRIVLSDLLWDGAGPGRQPVAPRTLTDRIVACGLTRYTRQRLRRMPGGARRASAARCSMLAQLSLELLPAIGLRAARTRRRSAPAAARCRPSRPGARPRPAPAASRHHRRTRSPATPLGNAGCADPTHAGGRLARRTGAATLHVRACRPPRGVSPAAVELLDQPLAGAEFLAVDTETNGLGGDACELTEVGAVLLGGGELHDRWASLVQATCRCAGASSASPGSPRRWSDGAPAARRGAARAAAPGSRAG